MDRFGIFKLNGTTGLRRYNGYEHLQYNYTNNLNVEIDINIVNEIIKNAVNQLSEKFKTVIILRDIQEISYEEISEIIGIPIGTVKSRINRARLQLQVELKYLRE